jgi:hypothetical protein
MEETIITTAVEEQAASTEVEGAVATTTKPKRKRLVAASVALGSALMLGIGVTAAFASPAQSADGGPVAEVVFGASATIGELPATLLVDVTAGQVDALPVADTIDAAEGGTLPASADDQGGSAAGPASTAASSRGATTTRKPAAAAAAASVPAAVDGRTTYEPTWQAADGSTAYQQTWHDEEGYWRDVPETGHWEHREALYGRDGYYGDSCNGCRVVFRGGEIHQHMRTQMMAGNNACGAYTTPVWVTTGEKLIEPAHDEWVVDMPAHQEWVVTKPCGWY